ncbi:MAG: thiamine-monophosphate kinase [Promethearchaeota archaeon]
MRSKERLQDLGEIEIIKILERLLFEKTGKKLIRDDSFFYTLKDQICTKIGPLDKIIFNSDMLVSSTDVPPHMNYYQIGRKSILMNISDLIVKGVIPKGLIISLGLPREMNLTKFKKLINGIIDYSLKWKLDYIGGDLNETKELIINPIVFGFQNNSQIIYRKGMKAGDLLISNGKFGLTGVGFDILINKRGTLNEYPEFKRSIESVIEIKDLGKEGIVLAKNHFASASIDSSDGLFKSLKDLMLSNPNLGFEIDFNQDLIDSEALKYSQDFKIPLEKLVFSGGEEFIHLFTINPKLLSKVQAIIQANGGKIFKIGRVISKNSILMIKDNKEIALKYYGFEHFRKMD